MARIRLSLLLFALVFAAAACSSTEPEETPVDPEEAYLSALSDAIKLSGEATDRFEQLLGPVFPTFATDDQQNFVILNALREEDVPGVATRIIDQIAALDPPEAFLADHAILTGNDDDGRRRADALRAALDEGDLPKLHLLRAELIAEGGSDIAALSPRACAGALAHAPEAVPLMCERSDIPGGDYGREVSRIFRSHGVEFVPRANLLQGLTDEQLMEALTYVQPEIVATFDRTIERLSAITPPEEYAVGHQVMLEFFTQQRSTAFAIDRAVAEGDGDAVQREFARSQDNARTAAERLPDDYRPLAPRLFPPR